MSLVLSPATEARIQAELATGRYAAPDELLNRALDSLKDEDEDLSANRSALAEKLQRGYDQATRGELYSPEQARAILAERRAARIAR
jgi:Arc/MetJ-type ribon-helix-helix transcriptional regulator